MTSDAPNSIAGVAACLALLEGEARMLGHPLAANLIAAAGAALMESDRAAPDRPALEEPRRLRPIAG